MTMIRVYSDSPVELFSIHETLIPLSSIRNKLDKNKIYWVNSFYKTSGNIYWHKWFINPKSKKWVYHFVNDSAIPKEILNLHEVDRILGDY